MWFARLIIVVCLLSVTGFVAAAGGEIDLVMKRSVVVPTRAVLVGDVVKVAATNGELRQSLLELPLLKLNNTEATRLVTRGEVESVIKPIVERFSAKQSWRGSQTVVRRKSHNQWLSFVRRTAVDKLKQVLETMGAERIEIEPLPQNSNVDFGLQEIVNDAPVEFAVFPKRLAKRMGVRAKVYSDRGKQRTLTFWYRVGAKLTAQVAARDIAVGEALGVENVLESLVDISDLASMSSATVVELQSGKWRALKPIDKGQTLFGKVSAVESVFAGRPMQVIFSDSNVEISIQAKALHFAEVGDEVRFSSGLLGSSRRATVTGWDQARLIVD